MMERVKRKRIVALIASAAILITGIGIAIGVSVAKNSPPVKEEGKEIPEGLVDMAAPLTDTERETYSGYLNMVCTEGIAVYFWWENGETYGTLAPLNMKADAEITPALREHALPLITVRRILREFPNVRVVVRATEGLTPQQIQEAKNICLIP